MRRERQSGNLGRRPFLKVLASAGMASFLGEAEARSIGAEGPAIEGKRRPFRGVNLGGWLVLERWLTPSLFEGVDAPDEARFCEVLGKEKAEAKLAAHRETFITEEDFRWIAAHGLNAVRIPVGYWVLDGDAPFLASPGRLDWAFDQAARHGLGVVLDLHAAPGSQNGWDHSGRQGPLLWHTKREYIDRTLDVLESLAKRYGKHDALIALEFLNEPRWDVPKDVLKDFYREGYRRTRRHLDKGRVAIMMHDVFGGSDWLDFLRGPEFENVVVDTHIYQCFTDEDKKQGLDQHVRRAIERRAAIEATGKRLPLCVGEWSAALPPESLRGLDEFVRDVGKRAYGDAQLVSFEAGWGWFFWTYKAENSPEWSFRDCVERGWMPAHCDGPIRDPAAGAR